MDFISQPELRSSADEPFCFFRLEHSDVPDCLKNAMKQLEVKMYSEDQSIQTETPQKG